MPLLSDDDINDLNNAFCNSNFRQNFLMALRETIIKEVIDSLPDFKDQMLAAIWTATHPRDMHVIFPKHYYWNDEVHFRGRGRKVRDVVRQMDILRELEVALGPNFKVSMVSVDMGTVRGFGFRADYFPDPPPIHNPEDDMPPLE
jgi:hypothetical protein